MIFGAHESVAGGLDNALTRARADACRAVQIFTKNSNTWREPVLTAEQIAKFRRVRDADGAADGSAEGRAGAAMPVLAHTSYLINLATDKPDVLARSKDALVAELRRSNDLGVDFVVLHPGAHLGAGVEAGVRRIGEALDEVLERVGAVDTRLLLENTAGQGSCVGCSFDELAAIFEATRGRARLGVCFDTQHAYAAGYDLTTDEGYEATFTAFDRALGLDKLRAFHLNDSKKALGSRVDRHEHIGEGLFGLGTFWRLANDARFEHHPGVVETEPAEGDTPYRAEVARLVALVGAPRPNAARGASA